MKSDERKQKGKPATTTADPAASEMECPDETAELAPEQATAELAGESDPVMALEADLRKWRELALRTAADLENYRKRMARDKQDAMRYANQALLEDLLPVLDNFEMGMEAAAAENGSMIYIGMDMVRRQFADLLAGQGVVPVPVAIEDEFDPSTQEAMAQEPSEEIAAGRIVRVIRRGFRLHDRLLRPATVVVSSGPAAAAAPSEG